MKTQLKYLGLTLAAQTRIAKRLARPSQTPSRFIPDLQRDIVALRNEARASNIALGFLRGRDLSQIERLPYRPKNEGHVADVNHEFGSQSHPNWDRVEDIVMHHAKEYLDAGILFENMQQVQQKYAEFVSARDNTTCAC